MKRLKPALALIISVILTLSAAGGLWAAESPDSSKKEIAVPVKDSARGITVTLHHVLLESNNGSTVQVREVLKIKSTTKETLKLSLPAGYSNLQVAGISKDSLAANPDGFTTSSPVSIGESQISFTYELPFSGDTADFSKVINYPTDILYVLSPKDQFKIKGDNRIQDYGLQTLEGQVYHVFFLSQPAPGQGFSLTINPDRVGQGYREPKSGFHSSSHLERWSSSPLKNTNPHYWVAAIIILFFALAAAAGHVLRKKHLNRQAEEDQERLDGLLDNLIIRQKRLLNKIASLDQKNEAGEIEAEEYTALRGQYINKLIKIKLKVRELEALEQAGE